MTRMRTLIAAALLTIPMLTVSAASPIPQSSEVMHENSLSAPQSAYCFFMAGYWWCY